jgi:hypothetical protein
MGAARIGVYSSLFNKFIGSWTIGIIHVAQATSRIPLVVFGMSGLTVLSDIEDFYRVIALDTPPLLFAQSQRDNDVHFLPVVHSLILTVEVPGLYFDSVCSGHSQG